MTSITTFGNLKISQLNFVANRNKFGLSENRNQNKFPPQQISLSPNEMKIQASTLFGKIKQNIENKYKKYHAKIPEGLKFIFRNIPDGNTLDGRYLPEKNAIEINLDSKLNKKEGIETFQKLLSHEMLHTTSLKFIEKMHSTYGYNNKEGKTPYTKNNLPIYRVLVEGFTEFFNSEMYGSPVDNKTYSADIKLARTLIDKIGYEVAAKAYFNSDERSLKILIAETEKLVHHSE